MTTAVTDGFRIRGLTRSSGLEVLEGGAARNQPESAEHEREIQIYITPATTMYSVDFLRNIHVKCGM